MGHHLPDRDQGLRHVGGTISPCPRRDAGPCPEGAAPAGSLPDDCCHYDAPVPASRSPRSQLLRAGGHAMVVSWMDVEQPRANTEKTRQGRLL